MRQIELRTSILTSTQLERQFIRIKHQYVGLPFEASLEQVL